MEVHPYDEITAERLRAGGSFKWSRFPGTLGAFIAEMDFGAAPPITEALHRAVDAMGFGYLTPAMQDVVGAACAAWQAERYGWNVLAEWIHPVADVLHALQVTLESYTPPGTPVVLPTPGYMPFLFVPPSMGREVIQVPTAPDSHGRWVLDLNLLEDTFRRVGRALLVLVNPHNPVGTVATRDELVALSELVARYDGIRVFADEIHAPLVYPGSEHVPYATVSAVAAEHSITATSASKAWNLPGLKCAQMILTSQADRDHWHKIGFLASMGTSNLGVVASTAAYTAGAEWLDETLDYLDGSRRLLADLVAEHLPDVIYRQPEGTYLAWLDCRSLDLATSPGRFFRREAGVSLVDGSECGAVGTGFVRLNFATPRPILRELVAQMGDALARR